MKFGSIYMGAPTACMDAKHHLFQTAVVITGNEVNGTFHLLHCYESLTVIKQACKTITILLEYSCSGCFLKGKLNI